MPKCCPDENQRQHRCPSATPCENTRQNRCPNAAQVKAIRQNQYPRGAYAFTQEIQEAGRAPHTPLLGVRIKIRKITA